MPEPATTPPRYAIAPGLDISRIVTGLWQVVDMERDGRTLDLDGAATALADYAKAGFDTFDMADHYGSAELIAGHHLADEKAGAASTVFTKWCPEPGAMTAAVVREAVIAASSGWGSRASTCCSSIGGRSSTPATWTR